MNAAAILERLLAYLSSAPALQWFAGSLGSQFRFASLGKRKARRFGQFCKRRFMRTPIDPTATIGPRSSHQRRDPRGLIE
jgi:hypothetical protein